MSKAAPVSNTDCKPEPTKAEQTARTELSEHIEGGSVFVAPEASIQVNSIMRVCVKVANTVTGPVVVASSESAVVDQAAADVEDRHEIDLDTGASTSTLIEVRKDLADA